MTFMDTALSRLMKLPRATSSYEVVRDVRIPMRDGVELLADHYVPSGTPRGTVLVRSPYGRDGIFALLYARPFAARGYHVLAVSCRATFGSGGVVNAFAGEAEDGADTVEFLRTQPWFTGTFATVGISYLGFNQWALLTDPPAEMVAAIIVAGPHDASELLRGTGALALQSTVGWSWAMLHQEDHGMLVGSVVAARAEGKLKPVLDGLPLRTSVRDGFDGKATWYDAWLDHPDITDPWWDSARHDLALVRTTIPVLLCSGWYDLILEQVVEQYVALAARGVDVQLVVGPWNHAELLTKAAGMITQDTLGWLDEHLAGDGKRLASAPVRLFVTGADEWRDLPSWPLPTTPQVMYLQPGGGLAPLASEGSAAFRYDPADPTPTVGGMSNARSAGRRDNTEHEKRSDVLTFTTPALDADLEVLGTPSVTLDHVSDNPYSDLFVRLCEVDAKGRSFNLAERFVRLSDAAQRKELELTLSPVAHRFRAGTRIRLQVSGGSHPMHDRNLGTDESPADSATMTASNRVLDLSTCRVTLPASR